MSRSTLRYPLHSPFRVQGYHLLWPCFPSRSTRMNKDLVTGLLRVRSPLLTESRLISFPPGTEMFQFPGFASCTYEFSARSHASMWGFPIRTSSGQSLFVGSPKLFADYHVLHRLLLPRHSPYALNYLPYNLK